MKLRIEKSLLARARTCADEVDMPLSKWAALALRHWRDGKVGRVATRKKSGNATREGSTVCTLPGDQGDSGDMRSALEAAVAWCEKRRHKPFKTDMVEGRDYVVVKGED